MSNKQLTKSLFWTFAESASSKVISFLVTLVLARLLLPEQYGTVSIVIIIVSFFDVFVVSGLASALIQKKDVDDRDYSTILWFSLLVALFFYIVLFFTSPYISNFYHIKELTPIIRVLSLRLFFTAINSVQNAYVSKNLMFKSFFYATLIGSVISGVIGIFLAYKDFGVWALVVQTLSQSFLTIIIVRLQIPLKIYIELSWVRFKSFFSFGWKLLVSSLLDTLYDEILGLSLSKKYTPSELAYYDKGRQLSDHISALVKTSLSKALFPIMSKSQDKLEQIKNIARINIKSTALVMSPFLLFLFAYSNEIIVILFTERWSDSAFYLRAMSFYYFFRPISAVNLNVIKSLGHSDVLLKNNLIRKIFGISLIIFIIIITENPHFVIVALLMSVIFDVMINILPVAKMIDYGIIDQFFDYFKYPLYAILPTLLAFLVKLFVNNIFVAIILSLSILVVTYLLILSLLHDELAIQLRNVFLRKFKK